MNPSNYITYLIYINPNTSNVNGEYTVASLSVKVGSSSSYEIFLRFDRTDNGKELFKIFNFGYSRNNSYQYGYELTESNSLYAYLKTDSSGTTSSTLTGQVKIYGMSSPL